MDLHIQKIYNTNAKQKNKNIIRPHRYTKHEMWATASDIVWSVCVCVCLLDTTESLTKTAEPIEMPFGLWTRVDPRNHVLGWGIIHQGKGPFWGDMSHLIVKYRQTLQ